MLPPSLLYEAYYRATDKGGFDIDVFYEAVSSDDRFQPVHNLHRQGDGSPELTPETSKEGKLPRVTIDTTEAQSFEAVEPGPYSMTIDEVKSGIESKENKVPMIEAYFKFDDPEVAKKAGRVIRNYMLAGKGAGFTREFLKAVTGEDYPIGQVLDFDTDDLVGRRVQAQISNREYSGRLQNEVDRVVASE